MSHVNLKKLQFCMSLSLIIAVSHIRLRKRLFVIALHFYPHVASGFGPFRMSISRNARVALSILGVKGHGTIYL